MLFWQKNGCTYLDTDILIQKILGISLEEIIKRRGIASFLDLESQVCTSIFPINAVVATGGSVIYRKQTMEHLKSIGTVVYLMVSLVEIEKRAGDLAARGVVIGEGQTLAELYYERTQHYEKWADVIVDETDLDPEGTADAVIEVVHRIHFEDNTGEDRK